MPPRRHRRQRLRQPIPFSAFSVSSVVRNGFCNTLLEGALSQRGQGPSQEAESKAMADQLTTADDRVWSNGSAPVHGQPAGRRRRSAPRLALLNCDLLISFRHPPNHGIGPEKQEGTAAGSKQPLSLVPGKCVDQPIAHIDIVLEYSHPDAEEAGLLCLVNDNMRDGLLSGSASSDLTLRPTTTFFNRCKPCRWPLACRFHPQLRWNAYQPGQGKVFAACFATPRSHAAIAADYLSGDR